MTRGRGGGREEVETESDQAEEERQEEKQEAPNLPQLTHIQKAYLDLCIELLNQFIGQWECDSVLVCVLAVLRMKTG